MIQLRLPLSASRTSLVDMTSQILCVDASVLPTPQGTDGDSGAGRVRPDTVDLSLPKVTWKKKIRRLFSLFVSVSDLSRQFISIHQVSDLCSPESGRPWLSRLIRRPAPPWTEYTSIILMLEHCYLSSKPTDPLDSGP